MRNTLLLLALFVSVSVFAQKKAILETQEDVEKMAAAEFELSMTGPEGELFVFGQEHKIEGEYDFKVTIGDRGKVVSIYVLNREGGSVQMQNKVKDAVKETRFNFKVPKDKNFSLEYKFIFH